MTPLIQSIVNLFNEGEQDPAELYTAFRGRLPGVDALLKGRGLAV